jgi:hypothetical protein
MKRVAASISLLIALILFGSVIVSVREQAEAASGNIDREFSAARTDSPAQFNAEMDEASREADEAKNMRVAEGISGAGFLVGAIALFASSRRDSAEPQEADNLSILQ